MPALVMHGRNTAAYPVPCGGGSCKVLSQHTTICNVILWATHSRHHLKKSLFIIVSFSGDCIDCGFTDNSRQTVCHLFSGRK